MLAAVRKLLLSMTGGSLADADGGVMQKAASCSVGAGACG